MVSQRSHWFSGQCRPDDLVRAGGRAVCHSGAGAAAVMVMTLATLSVFVAAPVRSETLVSNIDLTESADLSLSDAVLVQEFTAGDEGATLGGVEIRFSSASARLDAPTVTLDRREGAGHVAVAELAGPGKLAAGVNDFIAPAGAALKAGAVYAVRVEGGGSGAALRGTAGDGESGKDGWSIGDGSLRKTVGGASYAASAAALMIRVKRAAPGRRSDPFEPPLPPILGLDENTSADGAWTVSWSGPDGDDFYTYVELEETSPGGGVSTTTHYAAPGSLSVSGKMAAGAYSYRARGCRNLCSDWSASLTVTYARNSRPAVGAIADIAVSRGTTGSRTVTVTDADSGDAHTVSARSDDTSVATVSVSGKTLTVRGVSRGTATISVTATDDSGAPNATSAAATFTVTVPNSRPAVGAISDLTVSRGSSGTRTVTITDGDSGDAHTVSATSDDAAVATVSASGKRLTVRGVSRGTATISVTATDDSGAPNATSAAATFTVTVPNSRPAVGAISDLTVSRGSSGTRTVTITDGDSGDAHTVSATSDDAAVATVSASGKRLTVRGVSRGTATISVTATDDSGASNATSAAATFEATVPNSRPAVGSISDLTVSRGSSGTRTVMVTDGDGGDAHTVSASSDDTSVATVSVDGKRLTVRGVSRGTATISVTATDDSGASNATSTAVAFDATVPNSRPAVGSISDLTVSRGSSRTRTVAVTDGDAGDVHTVSVRSDDASVATVSVSGKTLTVRGESRGTATIAVTATDDSGESNATSAAATFDATVPNSRPAVGSISNLTVSRGSSGTRTVTITDGDGGDAHTVSASSDDTSVATVSVNGKTLTVRGASRGTATIAVTATDDSGASNATSRAARFAATVTVPAPSNSRPVVSPIAARTLAVGADNAIEVPVAVTDADAGDAHTVRAASADATVAEVEARGKTLTVTGASPGGARISVTATDDSGASNATSAPVTFMATVRGYTGELRARPNPSGDGAYALSWDAREGYTFHILLEGAAGAASKTVAYAGESRELLVAGKAAGAHRYELHHCNVTMVSMPFPLTLTSCAGTDIPEVTVTVNAPVGASNIVAKTEAGSTPHRTGTTQGGDAYVDIPIEPAPGVNGLVPMLSISYGGGRDAELAEQSQPWDVLGYGWRLGGFSAIRRCFVNRSGSAANLLDTDNLCLDGEPLVLTAGTALRPKAEYRLLRERFVKVTVKGAAPRIWFEVKGPDGSVSEYGGTEDSELHYITAYSNGKAMMSKAFQWSINKRTDAFGNGMSYLYHEDESAGVRHPLRIEYGDGGDAAVEFKYAHRSDLSPVMLGPGSTRAQAQNLLLREVRALRDASVGADGALSGTLVRAYRLQTETDGAKRRLDKVQLCGYDETGAGEKCLAPIDIDWAAPDADLSAVVSRLTDSLGRKTEFEYGILRETGDHAFLFAERPFGSPPANIAGAPALAGDDPNDAAEALRAVVTKMKRADGLADAETATSGWHVTSYAYQGRGRKSDRRWGFLGFDATRSTDGASGVVTYRRYRMDFPHYGEVAAVYEYHGLYGASGTETLSKRAATFAAEAIDHGGTLAARTWLPRADDIYDFHYEGGAQIGATKTDRELTLKSGLPASAGATATVYHSLAPPASGASAKWGAVPGSGSSPQRETASKTTFENVASGGKWVVGFASRIEEKHRRGGVSAADAAEVAAFDRHGDTMRPGKAVRFKGDSEHQLTTSYAYDADGNLKGATTGGRAESASNFVDKRYPGKLTNAAGHSETLTWDARFGLVATRTDANGRTTTLAYDAFGREKRRETPDGAVIETFYERCSATTCAAVSTGTDSVQPVMRIRRTSTIGPTTWRYLDKLGRTIRTESEGFAANSRVRRDTVYDARGRVRLSSRPHYRTGGTAHYFKYAYDVRGRVLSETRPDGSVAKMKYAVDGANRNRIEATATETVIGPDGMVAATRRTVSLYNVMGELVSRTEGANATAATDRATVTIAYNGAGQPTTRAAAGSATTFRYDAAGFRDRATSPNLGTVDFEYTQFGELASRKDGKGTTRWQYDALGRATKRFDPDGVAEWTWDPANGRGFLGSRCYRAHGAAAVASCDGLSAPDFRETLTYGVDARVKKAETKIGGNPARTYEREYGYYPDGRLKTIAHPSGLTAYYEYNARGHRTVLRNGSSAGAALETRTAMDAYGNVTGTTYGNGAATTRVFDPKTGLPTGIETVAKGGAKIQDNAYAWRSDGLLASRASHIGGNNARKEEFARDPLGRLTTATTKLGGAAKRTLSYAYDEKGNLKSKTSSVDSDIDVSAYGYDASKPHRLASATIGGETHKFSHDADGNLTKYDCTSATCVDDKFIDWNGRNLPERITVGGSRTDETPTSRDEFAHGPDGARYHRKTSHMDGETLRAENTYYVGAFEERLPHSGAEHTSIMQARVADGVRHVKTASVATADDGTRKTKTAEYVDYLHKDHLGSVEAATNAAGSRTRELAYDPFGGWRGADWTAALAESEVWALAGSSDPRTRGHTGHEHLDRTGLIHRGGRVYDPTLGRFLSPDPLVGNPGSAQSWNGYSYVSNSPMSYVDPSGLSQRPVGCGVGGLLCQGQGASGGGFGLASVVSTHRFQWVDIFFSVVPSRFAPATEPWINYSGGVGVGDSGWGSYDSYGYHDAFYFGIAYFSVLFNVTGQVAVAGTPDITRKPMGVIRGIGGLVEGTASVLIPGYDLYECYVAEGCTATDILFGAIEVGVTLTGVGYLGRVGVKGAARAYDAYKAAKNAKGAANPGANRRGGFTGPHRQRGAIGELRKDPSSSGKLRSSDGLKRHNNMARDAARAVGLNRSQRDKLHDEISRQGLSYREIVEVAKDIKAGRL
ncbi:MAG: Ig-like domain-containing protein [Gammaproteobacteria bacterium]|nr:Ig-like domain-containing protein [Gammaproteobacteria bacterium]